MCRSPVCGTEGGTQCHCTPPWCAAYTSLAVIYLSESHHLSCRSTCSALICCSRKCGWLAQIWPWRLLPHKLWPRPQQSQLVPLVAQKVSIAATTKHMLLYYNMTLYKKRLYLVRIGCAFVEISNESAVSKRLEWLVDHTWSNAIQPAVCMSACI